VLTRFRKEGDYVLIDLELAGPLGYLWPDHVPYLADWGPNTLHTVFPDIVSLSQSLRIRAFLQQMIGILALDLAGKCTPSSLLPMIDDSANPAFLLRPR